MKKHYDSILSFFKDDPEPDSEVIPIPTVYEIKKPLFETHVRVVNADMLDTALEYVSAGKKTLLHNMANPDIAGGNPWIVGAQEEDLFRRTNLHKYLSRKYYPIKTLVLSKDVKVIRSGLRKGYMSLETPSVIDIVSCPAVRHSSGGIWLSHRDVQIMTQRLRALFYTAAQNGYTHLVFSAWGCGGFGCPPEHVSCIFKSIIDEYNGCFEQITFAIWDENFPKSNFAIFSKLFRE